MVPRTLKPSKGKIFFSLICCLALVAVSVFVVNEDPHKKMGWAGVIFFGLASVAIFLQLFAGLTYLYVDENGILIRALWRKTFYPWNDIEGFDVLMLSANKMIGIFLTKERQKLSKLSKLNATIAGFHASIAMDFGKEHNSVIVFLNECLEKYRK